MMPPPQKKKPSKLKGTGWDTLNESRKTLQVCLDRNTKSCEGRTDVKLDKHKGKIGKKPNITVN